MSRASAWDWFQLGLNFEQNGSILDHEPYREAINAFTQSLNINAKHPKVWNERGVVEQNDLGNDVAALSDFQHASQLGSLQATKNYTKLKEGLAANAASSSQRVRAAPAGFVQECNARIGHRWDSMSGSCVDTGH